MCYNVRASGDGLVSEGRKAAERGLLSHVLATLMLFLQLLLIDLRTCGRRVFTLIL